jgi:2-aminoethylphosphonate-pyruvate transaminase
VVTETAVILAAGRGIRLGPLGQLVPKGFLQPDPRHPPIVVESIDKLRARGIERIVIVTGHLRTFYDELVAARPGLVAVHNPRFADTGSLYSLSCARDLVADDCLLLESDLVYEGRALDAALASARSDVIVVSGRTGSGDEVFVTASVDRITAISKDPALADRSVGELVGISKLSRRLFAHLMQQADFDASAEYETGGLTRIASSYPLYYTLLDDLVWAEIDTPAHFERVQRVVYPRLRRHESGHPVRGKRPVGRSAKQG